jgi:hypothetical protein
MMNTAQEFNDYEGGGFFRAIDGAELDPTEAEDWGADELPVDYYKFNPDEPLDIG